MSNVPTNLIPTTVTGLPEYTGSSTLGYLPYVVEGRTYKVQFSNIAAVGAVPSSRTIATGTGLTGGGDLSADRTIAIANGGVGTAQLAASGVSAGVYGSGTLVPVLTVDATGRVTSATTAAVSVSGFVPTSRSVIAGTGLTGGGALTSDVTLDVNFSSSTPQALGTATAGVSTAAARGDHVHPAVNLADTSQTQGALPLGRGGTGDALSPVAGAVVYSTGTRFALTALGLPGQVLMSDGANAPQWATVSGIGTVTSVNVSGGTTGLTFSGGPVTAAGTITMAGTLAVGNGGTGLTSLTANFVPKGNGTAAFSASQIFDNGTNVGIGTSSPTQKLSVNGSAVIGVAGGAGYVLGGNTGNIMVGEDASGSFVFAGINVPTTANLTIGRMNTTTIFQTDSGQERMRIISGGNVGIGTSTPSVRLHVVGDGRFTNAANTQLNVGGGTGQAQVVVEGPSGTNSLSLLHNGSGAFLTQNGGSAGFLFRNTAGDYTFSTGAGNTERMRITSAGDVGIGTTSPGARFNIEGNTNATSTVLFKNTNSATSAFFQLAFGNDANNSGFIRYTSSTGLSTPNSFLYYAENHLFHNLSAVERMRITSAGDVGIGTISPTAKLELSGNSEQTLRITSIIDGSAATPRGSFISYRSGSSLTETARISSFNRFANFTGGNLEFAVLDSSTVMQTRMVIDRAGLVGIGVTAPTARLDVTSASGSQILGRFSEGSAAQPELSVRSTATGVLLRSGFSSGVVGSFDITATGGFSYLTLGTNNTERARIDSSGNLLVGTTAAVGNANVVATTGFSSVTVTVAGSATATVTVPSGCICIISQAGFSGDAAIFAIKSTGGSQGTTVMGQGTAGAYGFGTTTDPNTGTRTDLWISGSNTLSIKDKTTVSRNFYLTFISNGL